MDNTAVELTPMKVFVGTGVADIAPRKSAFNLDNLQIDNEFLYPGKQRIIPGAGYEELQKNFDYISDTMDLEVDSPRVTALQSIVDTMLEGSGEQARVVIARKSAAPRGFVFPDGTMIVNQEILNRLDTMDEVAGILAHESGHLLLGTHELSSDWTVGWLHEGVIDPVIVKKLMVKAKFNSLAHADALEKISGKTRDHVHMTGLTRGALVIAAHAALHSETSSKQVTPILHEFHATVRPTNIEIAQDAVRNNNPDLFRRVLENAHPSDLKRVSDRYYFNLTSELAEVLVEEVLSRLKQAGYSEDDRLFYQLYKETDHPFQIIPDGETLERLIPQLERWEADRTVEKMDKTLFGKAYPQDEGDVSFSFIRALQKIIESHIRKDLPRRVVPYLDDNRFLRILEKLNASPLRPVTEKRSHSIYTFLVRDYVEHVIVKRDNIVHKPLDVDRIRNLYGRINEMKYAISNEPLFTSLWSWNNTSEIESQLPILRKLYNDAFGVEVRKPTEEKPLYDINKIDAFFDEHRDTFDAENFSAFLADMQRSFRETFLTDEQRLKYIERVYDRIGGLSITTTQPLLSYLEYPNLTEKDHPQMVKDSEGMNEKLIKLNLRMLTGYTLFWGNMDRESRLFYTYMAKSFEESSIQSRDLSDPQLFTLFQGFFITGDMSSGPNPDQRKFLYLGPDGIKDFYFPGPTFSQRADRSLNLAFIQDLAQRMETREYQSLDDLMQAYRNDYVPAYRRWSSYSLDRQIDPPIFSDKLYPLVMGRELRKGLTQWIAVPDPNVDILTRIGVIRDLVPESVSRQSVIKILELQYIKDEHIPFEERLAYLEQNINTIGVEGAMALADLIQEQKQFDLFDTRMGDLIKQELKGSRKIQFAANAEYITSLRNDFRSLFRTASERNTGELSTAFADQWFQNLERERQKIFTVFDPAEQKFRVGEDGIDVFRSISDLITSIQSIPPETRYVIVQKALTDTRGAFTSLANRQALGNLAKEALGLRSGFVNNILQATCQIIDPKYGSYPIASMLSPMLFRAFDPTTIDLEQIKKLSVATDLFTHPSPKILDVMDDDHLRHLLSSETHQIRLFNSDYTDDPQNFGAQISREKNMYYSAVLAALRRAYLESVPSEIQDLIPGLDPGTDAVLSGLAAIGAPVTRGFQLSRQLYTFSDPIEQRLDDFFDRNPGINPYLFWKNLVILQEAQPVVREYFQKHPVTFGDIVGKGSLYTSREGWVTWDKQPRHVVVKILNPNAEAFVDKSYVQSQAIFDQVEKVGNDRDGTYMQVARIAAKLSYDWCKREINDTRFLKDDAILQNNADIFNVKIADSGITYEIPDLLFHTKEITVEAFQKGSNLKTFLADTTIDDQLKQYAVQGYAKFYFSMFGDVQVTDPETNERLVLSNPSVGNCMVAKEGTDLTLGIIDRNLYLRFSPEEIRIFQEFLHGNNRQFIDRFLDKVYTRAGQQGVGKVIELTKMKAEIVSIAVKQKMSGTQDNFEIFRTILQRLQNQNIEVPLDYRLTIGNIETIRRLCQKYGVDTTKIVSN